MIGTVIAATIKPLKKLFGGRVVRVGENRVGEKLPDKLFPTSEGDKRRHYANFIRDGEKGERISYDTEPFQKKNRGKFFRLFLFFLQPLPLV